MRNYKNGYWGLGFLWTLRASPFPRAFMLAFPNAVITYVLSDSFHNRDPDQEKLAFSLWAGFTSVLGFLLYFRSQKAYSRWWEGGTLLQQVRGEWFNAYSSLIAFCSPDPAKQDSVDEFQHMLGRLMSLLLCAALQQVSPQQRSRSFELIEVGGIDVKSLNFLTTSPDAVEVIIQWIQRSTVLNMGSGVLHVPPPVLSRVFQELSRGIVNLQNARKIAEFPFPFPFAQTSVVMLIIHWFACPAVVSLMLEKHLAAATSFTIIFFFWCVNYISLSLEMPYGDQANDLPLDQMQSDWNRSLSTLLSKTAQCPPRFTFDPDYHHQLRLSTSAEVNKDISQKLYSGALISDDETMEKPFPGTTDEARPEPSVRSSVVKPEPPAEDTPGDPAVQSKLRTPRKNSLTSGTSKGSRLAQEHADEAGAALKAQDVLLFDAPATGPTSTPSRAAPKLGSHDVGAMVVGAYGGSITVTGLGEREREVSPGSSRRPSLGSSKSGGSQRHQARGQIAGPHGDGVGGHGPPWTWDVGSGARCGRTGPSVQCSAGCLQALVKLRPASIGASVTIGS